MPKVALAPPSAAASRQLVDLPIDLRSGDRLTDRSRTAFVEHFRLDPQGRVDETQYRLVPAEQAYASRHPGYGYGSDGDSAGVWGDERQGRGAYAQAPWWRDDPGMQQQQPGWRQPTTPPWWDDEDPRQRRSRRVDPDYPWRNQIY